MFLKQDLSMQCVKQYNWVGGGCIKLISLFSIVYVLQIDFCIVFSNKLISAEVQNDQIL